MKPPAAVKVIRRVSVLHVALGLLAVSVAASAQESIGTPVVIPPWLAEVVAVLGWPGVVAYVAWQAHRSVVRFSTALEKASTAYAPAVSRMAAACEELAPAMRRALTDGAQVRVAHDVVSGSLAVHIDGGAAH